jgi:hypothetical protein
MALVSLSALRDVRFCNQQFWRSGQCVYTASANAPLQFRDPGRLRYHQGLQFSVPGNQNRNQFLCRRARRSSAGGRRFRWVLIGSGTRSLTYARTPEATDERGTATWAVTHFVHKKRTFLYSAASVSGAITPLTSATSPATSSVICAANPTNPALGKIASSSMYNARLISICSACTARLGRP